ncbi:arylsulfatase [Candidatus Laterigemmans baculatus]|uniref:arylsulfatase n=1 Tax=Candidatus Laterigemmans baculatus TaxID=2770505 RepID=UPI0013DC5244|nr:arylsulfatase [Candidatus Laterigemmans baculatus]
MRSFIAACALGIVAVTSVLASASDRPNVVLIITDDQGYGDLGCHGNPVLQTPHLDELARQSMRLTDYHVSPTCSPTRAALQTGRCSNRTGVWHTIMGRSILRRNEVTMGQVFADAGYATGLFGKWHLGDNFPSRPEDRGYNEVLRHGGGGVGQTPDYWNNAYFGGSYFHNGNPQPFEGFCTDVWFAYARNFIRTQRRIGKPFFACIATNAPHGPMHSPPAAAAPYAELPSHVANFYGMIANIDENVGRLRSFLAQEGLSENTIFIFTTDNGTAAGGKIFNAGMRGTKGSPYDGGHRVPFFISWPAGGLQGPAEIDTLTAHVDVLPTLIDLCEIESPQGVAFDGRSIRPLLDAAHAQKPAPWPERILVTDSQRVKDPIKWRQSAVMSDRWRLINGEELYEITIDPGQQNDVAADNPQVVAELRAFYESWWQELEPGFADDAFIVIGHPAENPATLTCHDWITTRLSPWNQAHIREAMGGEENTGYWNVEVATAGEYVIRLRRWPREADAALDAALPAGEEVPGERAYRARPGEAVAIRNAKLQIADRSAEQSVPAGAKEARFRLRLPAGPTRLTASFETEAGETLGAYYVVVEKL